MGWVCWRGGGGGGGVWVFTHNPIKYFTSGIGVIVKKAP